MMRIPISDAKRMTWWEYQAVLWTHNDRHAPPEEEEIEAPDPEYVARRMARNAERGLARSLH